MKRTDVDFPSVLRSTDEYEQMMAEQMRGQAQAQPATGDGIRLALAFALAGLAMLAVAFVVELAVMP